jgi:hypothetical protein
VVVCELASDDDDAKACARAARGARAASVGVGVGAPATASLFARGTLTWQPNVWMWYFLPLLLLGAGRERTVPAGDWEGSMMGEGEGAGGVCVREKKGTERRGEPSNPPLQSNRPTPHLRCRNAQPPARRAPAPGAAAGPGWSGRRAAASGARARAADESRTSRRAAARAPPWPRAPRPMTTAAMRRGASLLGGCGIEDWERWCVEIWRQRRERFVASGDGGRRTRRRGRTASGERASAQFKKISTDGRQKTLLTLSRLFVCPLSSTESSNIAQHSLQSTFLFALAGPLPKSRRKRTRAKTHCQKKLEAHRHVFLRNKPRCGTHTHRHTHTPQLRAARDEAEMALLPRRRS